MCTVLYYSTIEKYHFWSRSFVNFFVKIFVNSYVFGLLTVTVSHTYNISIEL